MCPVCGKSMVVYELEGVEIDRCLSCGGTWLDRGELERIAAAAGGNAGGVGRALQGAGRGVRSRRRCPRCRRRLREVPVPEASVDIDRCPRGHGVWLDRGEMEAVVAVGGGEEAVARFLGDLYGKELGSRDRPAL